VAKVQTDCMIYLCKEEIELCDAEKLTFRWNYSGYRQPIFCFTCIIKKTSRNGWSWIGRRSSL